MTKPPHNIDAEQGLLGAILFDNAVLDRVGDLIERADFYEPLNAKVYDTILKLRASDRAATPITMRPFFENDEAINPELSAVGYLARLYAQVPSTMYAVDYAKTIVDLSRRRALMKFGLGIAEAVQDASPDYPVGDLIAEAEQDLFRLSEGRRVDGAIAFSATLTEALQDISGAYQRGGKMAGLATGLIDLDKKLGGLQPSDLIIAAGRPSMGKTALAFDIAGYLAGLGVPVGAFSLEMSGKQVSMRLLAQRVEIASDLMRRGDITEAQFGIIAKKAEELGRLPLHIDETGGLTFAKLASRTRRMKRKHKIQALFIDYLQLAKGSGRENRTQDVTEITTGLKALAKELNIPVILLSQLNRKVEEREDKRPQLADLRDSGSIEQDADVVIFVYRHEYYVEREKPSDDSKMQEWIARLAKAKGKAELIIGKNRNGPTGTVQVAFNTELTQFSNLARVNAYETARQRVA
jgi:replicative DNA helicase